MQVDIVEAWTVHSKQLKSYIDSLEKVIKPLKAGMQSLEQRITFALPTMVSRELELEARLN